MSTNRLTYFVNSAPEMNASYSDILLRLDLVELRPLNSSTEVSRFELQSSKFGKQLHRNLDASLDEALDNAVGFLVYRPMNSDSINEIVRRCQRIHYKVYILTHDLLDYEVLLRQLYQAEIMPDQIVIITRMGFKLNDRSLVVPAEILHLPNAVSARLKKKTNRRAVPFFLLQLSSFLLRPSNEARVEYLPWIHHAIELFHFVAYVLRRSGEAAYRLFDRVVNYLRYRVTGWLNFAATQIHYRTKNYLIYRIYGASKDFLKLRVYWPTRHFLMVDVYWSTRRLLSHYIYGSVSYFSENYIYWPLRHFLIVWVYWPVRNFITGQLYPFIINILFYPPRKVFWFFQYHYRNWLEGKSDPRVLFLPLINRSFELGHFTAYCLKQSFQTVRSYVYEPLKVFFRVHVYWFILNVPLYPVRKMIWFCQFQYQKRILGEQWRR